MAATKMNIKNYCNTLYIELEGMKLKLQDFIREIEGFQGKEGEHVRVHADHLRELINNIDWKLEIFSKACPLDSGSFSEDAIEGGSVPLGEPEPFSGGYLGG